MEKESLRGLQLKELEILKRLRSICDGNGLRYYLAFGTLLGAVRHRGFIPWDDDIDVAMPVRDMERLERLFLRSPWDGLFLQTPRTDPGAGLTYFKLRMDRTALVTDKSAGRDMHQGICIDIYPLCRVADGRPRRKTQYLAALLYMLLREGEPPENHGSLARRASGVLLFLLRGRVRDALRDFCYRRMTRYEGTPTKDVATLCCNPTMAARAYPADAFARAVPLTFEGEEFAAPAGYDTFLAITYGDYRKLPPKEEQGAKLSHILALDTERTYLRYRPHGQPWEGLSCDLGERARTLGEQEPPEAGDRRGRR